MNADFSYSVIISLIRYLIQGFKIFYKKSFQKAFNLSFFFCNQKKQKFRGSDSPDPKTARQGQRGKEDFLKNIASFVFPYFLPLNRRLQGNTQFPASAEIARPQRKLMLAISR